MRWQSASRKSVIRLLLYHLGRLDFYIHPVLAICLLFVLVLQVTARYVRGISFPWTLEVLTIIFGAIIWFGISTAIKEGGHVGITLFVDPLPKKVQAWLEVVQLLLLGVFLAFVFHFALISLEYYLMTGARTPALRLPRYWARVSVAPGLVFCFYRIIEKLLFLLRGLLNPEVEVETVKLTGRGLEQAGEESEAATASRAIADTSTRRNDSDA